MPQYIFYKNIFVCPGFAKFTLPMFLKKYHNSTMSMNPVLVKKKPNYLLLLLSLLKLCFKTVSVYTEGCKQRVKYTMLCFLGIYNYNNSSHKSVPPESKIKKKNEALKMGKLWNFGSGKCDLLNAMELHQHGEHGR